jgi:hypothetical protein
VIPVIFTFVDDLIVAARRLIGWPRPAETAVARGSAAEA